MRVGPSKAKPQIRALDDVGWKRREEYRIRDPCSLLAEGPFEQNRRVTLYRPGRAHYLNWKKKQQPAHRRD